MPDVIMEDVGMEIWSGDGGFYFGEKLDVTNNMIMDKKWFGTLSVFGVDEAWYAQWSMVAIYLDH